MDQDDITQKLRSCANALSLVRYPKTVVTMRSAADEICRLRNEIEHLRSHIQSMEESRGWVSLTNPSTRERT